MSGFTKLVPEIIQSSIWNEPPEIRCVWIAMIAMKDQDGNLRGNYQTIARMANVSLDWADKALQKFQSPDPYSNNTVNEGRRIEAIPGGWHVVSHELYRAKDYREFEAERKKKYRENKAMSGTCPGHVPDSSVSVSVSASDSASKREVKEGEKESDGFDDFWEVYPRKVSKGAARKAWKQTHKTRPSIDIVVGAVKAQLESVDWKRDGGKFIQYPATWLRAEKWTDEVVKASDVPEKTAREIWTDCANRCKHWDDKKLWCKRHVVFKPERCELCNEF